MESNLEIPKSQVAVTPPPPRPRNMRSTVEEILLRRTRGIPAPGRDDRARRRPAFPPPPNPYGVFSKIARQPVLAALSAYGVWMAGWAYYLWSLAGES